jgi:hypothetical protein
MRLNTSCALNLQATVCWSGMAAPQARRRLPHPCSRTCLERSAAKQRCAPPHVEIIPRYQGVQRHRPTRHYTKMTQNLNFPPAGTHAEYALSHPFPFAPPPCPPHASPGSQLLNRLRQNRTRPEQGLEGVAQGGRRHSGEVVCGQVSGLKHGAAAVHDWQEALCKGSCL